MYEVGQPIILSNIRGKITERKIDTQIGFAHENNREPMYTLVFENVPESLILQRQKENGTGKESNGLPPSEEGEPDRGES